MLYKVSTTVANFSRSFLIFHYSNFLISTVQTFNLFFILKMSNRRSSEPARSTRAVPLSRTVNVVILSNIQLVAPTNQMDQEGPQTVAFESIPGPHPNVRPVLVRTSPPQRPMPRRHQPARSPSPQPVPPQRPMPRRHQPARSPSPQPVPPQRPMSRRHQPARSPSPQHVSPQRQRERSQEVEEIGARPAKRRSGTPGSGGQSPPVSIQSTLRSGGRTPSPAPNRRISTPARQSPPQRREAENQLLRVKRAKRRFKPGTIALREIKKYQKTTNPLIAKAPFGRVVREIVNQHGQYSLTPSALECFQTASEGEIVQMMEVSQLAALNSKRVTLQPKDIQLIMRIQKMHRI